MTFIEVNMGQLLGKPSSGGARTTSRSPTPLLIPASSDSANAETTASGCSTDKPHRSNTSQKRPGSASATRAAVAVMRAIDERNVRKLKKALHRYGCRGWSELMTQCVFLSTASNAVMQLSSIITHHAPAEHPPLTLPPVQSSSLPSQATTRPTSLLDYAVEKNFVAGVELLIQAMSTSDVTQCDKIRSVTSAFMKTCDSGYLRLNIFNMFIDAAIDGRIQLDLHAAYAQLVDHYMYRKPFDLVRKPFFDLSSLSDSLCRITPLGLCVIHDDPEAIEEFTRRGANIDGYDREGNTALLRAGYGMKRACFRKILLLGADPNHRSRRLRQPTSTPTTFPYVLTTSPLIAVCMAFGHCMRTRTDLIAVLVACGLNPSVDRDWFAVALGIPSSAADVTPRFLSGVNTTALHNCLVRRLEESTRKTLIELCSKPVSLETQCCRVVRQQIANTRSANGVERNIDQLTLPYVIKAKLKLENLS